MGKDTAKVGPFFQCNLSGITDTVLGRCERVFAALPATAAHEEQSADLLAIGIVLGAMEACLRLQNNSRPAQLSEGLFAVGEMGNNRSAVPKDDLPVAFDIHGGKDLDRETLRAALQAGRKRIDDLQRAFKAVTGSNPFAISAYSLPPFDEFLIECATSTTPIRLAAAVAAFEYGANPDCSANGCWGLLHVVAKSGDIEFARVLLDNGADMEFRTLEDEFTPLMVAAINGKGQMVTFLIGRGAKRDAVSYDCETAADLATKYGHPEIAVMIASNNGQA